MLPDFNTCVDRINAYSQMAVYKEAMIAMGAHRSLSMGFRRFWNYKMGVEAGGHSILDGDQLRTTAVNLSDFLISWGMGRTGIADVLDIEGLLGNMRPNYDRLQGVVLGGGQIELHRANLEEVYAGLDGITNIGDDRGASITGRSKALLAIWGQTPGFDSLTRRNFLKWIHPPAPTSLRHLQRSEEWYAPSQFVDMIADLDDWVRQWSANNAGMDFVQSLVPLCGDLPVGRVIDEIYNWGFECETLLWYLKLLQACGDRQASLRFDELPGVLGFAPERLQSPQWWKAEVEIPLDRARRKANRKEKPGWRIADLNIPRQSIRFCCD